MKRSHIRSARTVLVVLLVALAALCAGWKWGGPPKKAIGTTSVLAVDGWSWDGADIDAVDTEDGWSWDGAAA